MTPIRIKLSVATYFKKRITVFEQKSRQRNIVIIRQIAHYLARKLTLLSLSEIGCEFGTCDHATVLYSCKQVQNMIDTKYIHQGERLKDIIIEIEKDIFKVTENEDHCRHEEMIENAFVFT